MNPRFNPALLIMRSLRTRAGYKITGLERSFSPRLAVFWLHETEDNRPWPAKFARATGALTADLSAGFQWRF